MANIVQKIVNRRAQAKYATFWSSLMQVGMVLDDARKLADRMDDADKPPWYVADAATIRKAIRRVEAALGTLGKNAKRWEAELISREWRK
jgi:hypothetical protein